MTNALVGQLVESARLERVCWGFESLQGHQIKEVDMRSRAFRRHQLDKKKKLARKIYPHDTKATWANHLHACSCYMCGNPRKHWKTKTLQEIKADQAQMAQLADASDSNPEC
jgi:hypothetical protein